MRDYLYISDAKVDIYLPQISSAEKRKIAGRLGVNIGVFQASLATERVPLENRVHRLEAVEAKIRKVKSVGSVESSGPWIEGTVDAVAATFPQKDNVMFFFSASDSHFLGLAGSAHHIVGNVRQETASSSISHLESLIANLEAMNSSHFAPIVDKPDEVLSRFVHQGVHQTEGHASSWTGILAGISSQFEHMPAQTITFLARRLTSDTLGADGMQYTLATPLYITLNEVV